MATRPTGFDQTAQPAKQPAPFWHRLNTFFTFPLQSVESVTPVDAFTLLVGLDNNYPGGNGRVPGVPDGTEIITLRSTTPLRWLRVESCDADDDDDRRDRKHHGDDDCR